MSVKVPTGFSLGETKVAYLITYGLGPYFKQLVLDDLGEGNYSLCFDETTNEKSEKELQLQLRFWSKSEEKIVYRHLETLALSSATAEILSDCILDTLAKNKLPLNKLLMVGSDGPRVNKKVWRIMNKAVSEVNGYGLVDIGTCNLHVVHSSFYKAVQVFGIEVSEVLTLLHAYFNKWPFECESFWTFRSLNTVSPRSLSSTFRYAG